MKKEEVNKQKRNKGFTLLEMLVVVLIIGILAAVALPQYQISVEKAKATEALIDMRTIVEAIERNSLINGLHNPQVTHDSANWDIELSGGNWYEYYVPRGKYIKENFTYLIQEETVVVFALRCNGKCQNTEDPWGDMLYGLEFYLPSYGESAITCFADNAKGQRICKALEGLGIKNLS